MTIVKRPLIPALVHDDTTRIIICIVGLIIVSYILYRIALYYGR